MSRSRSRSRRARTRIRIRISVSIRIRIFRLKAAVTVGPLPSQNKCPPYFVFRRFTASWSYTEKLATTFFPSELGIFYSRRGHLRNPPPKKKCPTIFCILAFRGLLKLYWKTGDHVFPVRTLKRREVILGPLPPKKKCNHNHILIIDVSWPLEAILKNLLLRFSRPNLEFLRLWDRGVILVPLPLQKNAYHILYAGVSRPPEAILKKLATTFFPSELGIFST